jgi:hypothetical protein
MKNVGAIPMTKSMMNCFVRMAVFQYSPEARPNP